MESDSFVETLDKELPIRQATHDCEEESLVNIMPRAPVTVEEDHFPTSSESSVEEDDFPGFLLLDLKDVPAMEEEIHNLKNLVQSLQEREKYLEMKLLEFHGLKEQEASITELQNMLKISATETNLLSLKIESLKAENDKLRAKLSDYSIVKAELKMEKENVAVLKSRMETVCEEAKEKINDLHTRVQELSERERKDLEDSVHVEEKLKRLSEVEAEVMKLQKEKLGLVIEKAELKKRLSSEHILLNASVIRSPDSVQNGHEFKPLEEELNRLREESDKLKKEMEQLQTSRCAEIEELVYLRWVNACLRYELRNYRLPPGETVARDLSRCLSLNSEQKLKQLILEYSNSGFDPNQNSLTEINLDDFSSQESCEETSHGCPKSKPRKGGKSKFIGKLKRLVLGKKNRHADTDTPSSDANSERRGSGSTSAMDEMPARNSSDSIASCSVERGSGRDSLDLDKLRRLNLEGVQETMRVRSKSDLGEVYGRKSRIFVHGESFRGSGFTSFIDDEEGGAPEKGKLKKFAQIFKKSQRPVKLEW